MDGILRLFLYLIGIVWVIVGSLLVFATDLFRNKIKKIVAKADYKKMSAIPFAIGILLLLSAKINLYTTLVTLLGLLAIIKGIFCILSTEKMKKISDWWLNKANKNVLRAWGIIIIIIGSIVLMGI